MTWLGSVGETYHIHIIIFCPQQTVDVSSMTEEEQVAYALSLSLQDSPNLVNLPDENDVSKDKE